MNIRSSFLPYERGPNQTDGVAAWLEWAGFRFDPFVALDAAADPHLNEYLVGHDIFAQIWGDGISWVFAPAGGGKTALRISVSRACWIGQETNRPFPIPYIPPFLSWGHASPSLDDHLLALVRAATTTLFLAMAYRPHWLFRLGERERQEVREAFRQNLPGPLSFYLERCRQEGQVDTLREVLDPTFILHNPPARQTLLQWCDMLDKETHLILSPPSPLERWHRLKKLLLDILCFPCIYILADGFDGAPETISDPSAVVSCLAPLMRYADQWAEEKIFLKGFLPEETLIILQKEFPQILAPTRILVMEWTPALLAEVIRRRVYVATEGSFGSLDAVASPGLCDLETILAKTATPPIPREMLILTRRLLESHIKRQGTTGLLEVEDVNMVVKEYNRRGH